LAAVSGTWRMFGEPPVGYSSAALGRIRRDTPLGHRRDLSAQNTGVCPPSLGGVGASASGGWQSVLRENREPVRMEVAIRVVQGFPDPLP
jgi:hypothetical protein